MNYLDIIIAIPLLWFGFKGFKNGLVMEIILIVALIAGIYLSIQFSDWVCDFLTLKGEYAKLGAFTITFISVVIALLLGGKMLEALLKTTSLSILNHLGGLLLGTIKAILLCGVLFFLCQSFDPQEKLITREEKKDSLLFLPIEKANTWLWPQMITMKNKTLNIIN